MNRVPNSVVPSSSNNNISTPDIDKKIQFLNGRKIVQFQEDEIPSKISSCGQHSIPTLDNDQPKVDLKGVHSDDEFVQSNQSEVFEDSEDEEFSFGEEESTEDSFEHKSIAKQENVNNTEKKIDVHSDNVQVYDEKVQVHEEKVHVRDEKVHVRDEKVQVQEVKVQVQEVKDQVQVEEEQVQGEKVQGEDEQAQVQLERNTQAQNLAISIQEFFRPSGCIFNEEELKPSLNHLITEMAGKTPKKTERLIEKYIETIMDKKKAYRLGPSGERIELNDKDKDFLRGELKNLIKDYFKNNQIPLFPNQKLEQDSKDDLKRGKKFSYQMKLNCCLLKNIFEYILLIGVYFLMIVQLRRLTSFLGSCK